MAVLNLLSVLLLLIVGVVITALFVLYPKYYRKSVNKSIENNRTVKAIEPTTLYGGVLLIVIILFSIVTVSKMNTLSVDNINMQSKINNIKFENKRLLETLFDVQEELNTVLHMNDYVQYIDYDVISKDDSNENNYFVDLSFVITENVSTQELTLFIEHDNEKISFDLDELTTKQVIRLSLSLHEDYTIYIMAEENGESQKHDIEEFNLYNYLSNRFELHYESEYINGEANIKCVVTNRFYPMNDLTTSNLLRLDTVTIKIYDSSNNLIVDSNEFVTNVSSTNMEYFYFEYREQLAHSWTVEIEIVDNFGITYRN